MMVVATAALSLFLTSCGQKATEAQVLNLDGEWTIEKVGEVAAFADVNAPAMMIEGDKMNGQTGCNSFFGDVVLGEENAVSFANTGSTKMACEESAEQENAILAALELVSAASLEDDALLLLDAEGNAVLTLKKAE